MELPFRREADVERRRCVAGDEWVMDRKGRPRGPERRNG
jgi:hypothetical protein